MSTGREVPGPQASAGYASRIYERWYELRGPFYDWLVWWCLLPLGGEAACRRELVRWMGLAPGLDVLSLCCGTGTTERAMLRAVPELRVLAIDLGPGQIARAIKKNPSPRCLEYRVGDAAATGLADASFDRVVITLALHEMWRSTRLAVLSEAGRLCRSRGQVVAIEHGRPRSRLSRAARWFWWFYWLPGNPEVPTTLELQRRGLAAEMEEAGLDVIETRHTSPDWIEGVVGRPRADRPRV